MGDNTKIEWTDATWNPITGCSVVSPGCTNCYAMKLAGTRLRHHPTRDGLTTDSKAGPVWNGQVRLNAGMLAEPLRWKRPRRIFVCAHGDLFHEAVPDAWIDRVFAVMALSPQHTFQVLTKRPERMRAWFARPGLKYGCEDWVAMQICELRPIDPNIILTFRWPLPNVWLGVSAEDQTRADERIPILLDTPAAKRFVSLEPLLGPIQLRLTPIIAKTDQEPAFFIDPLQGDFGLDPLDWVIIGGESGPNTRPMHPDWARQIRDDCAAAGVPFFFKQWGDWLPGQNDVLPGFDGQSLAHWQDGKWGVRDCIKPAERNYVTWDAEGAIYNGTVLGKRHHVNRWASRVGKRAAGRALDGVTHDGMPEVLA